jgi:N,N'-diacetyllegionaminate synthase
VSVLVVAEVGSVHDGSFGNARELVKAAAACGVDAVKFQTHIAAAETLRSAPPPPFFSAEPRFEYFARTAFTPAQLRELAACAADVGVEFLSSPFSVEAVAVLEEVGIPRYKIPSGEVTNLPLLQAVAATGKPVLLSSGMSTWAELDEAVRTLGAADVTLLQCTSMYPCPDERVGLNVLGEMRARYGRPVGFSDHTLDAWAPLAAVALGATVVEKHFTFSRLMYGSDARHSMEPADLAALVRGIRAVERMLASPVDKDDLSGLDVMKRTFEKSLVTLRDVDAGTALGPEMVGVKKPGTGIPPRHLGEVVGRRARRHLPAETVLQWDDLEA